MSRGLMVLLALSMAANVALGFFAGRNVAAPPSAEWRGPPPDMGRGFGLRLGPDMETLSPEAREAFRKAFDMSRDTLKNNHREARRLRSEFSRALAADPWSRAEVDAAAAALRAAEGAQQAAMTQLLIEAFEGLSAADRKALVEAMDKRRDRGLRMRLRERGPDGERVRMMRRPGMPDDMPPPPEWMEDEEPPEE